MTPSSAPPLRIGLTGGIGSGKTQVADHLERLGARVIDTDRIAHALTSPGGGAMVAIAEQFGAHFLTADGALDRQAMREAVFHDPAQRTRLEAILHPRITEVALAQSAAPGGGYQVFVVPLLVESRHWQTRVDRVAVVDCDTATQVARVQARNGLPLSTIEGILASQASREQRLAVADDIIDNGATTTLAALLTRTEALHAQWLALQAVRQGLPDAPNA